MTYEDIRYEIRDETAWITINRPAVRNALRGQSYSELTAAFRQVDQDEAVRFAVLTGEGSAFCSGDDVQAIFLAEDRDEVQRQSRVNRYRSLRNAVMPTTLAMMECEKPIICAVNGPAVGWGMDLTLNCDIRIASEKAKFASLFIRRGGLATTGGLYVLPRVVGLSRAMELLLTGEVIDANEAARIGLVSRAVPHEQLLPAVEELLEKLSWGAPLSQRATKRVMRKGLTTNWFDLEEYAVWFSKELWDSDDHKEFVAAYLEKRQPKYQSR